MLCAGSTNFPLALYYTEEWKNIDNFMCTSDIFSMEKGKRGNNGSYSASRHVHRAPGRGMPILYSPDRPMNMKCHTCLGLMSFALRVAMLVLCPCWRLSAFMQRRTFTPLFREVNAAEFSPAEAKSTSLWQRRVRHPPLGRC